MMTRWAFLIICLGILAALAAAIYNLDIDFSNDKVQQGAIAGGVIISGWFVTFFFREISMLLERSEKSKDLQMALSAEIYDYCETLKVEDQAALEKSLGKNVINGGTDSPYFPFVPSISKPIVFDVLSEDIRVLPRDTTDLVVQFYSSLSDIDMLVTDMNSDPFRDLSGERRLAVYVDFFDMRNLACDIGEEALDELEKGIAGPWNRLLASFWNLLVRPKPDQ